MNKLNKMIAVMFVCALMLVFAGYTHSQDGKLATGAEETLKKTFPNLTFSSIKETHIKGLYEVVIGDGVMYFHPDGYIIFGEMWNKEGENLTAKTREIIMAEKAKKIPLDKAIKMGSGKNTVVEFTDPDCPYCRKASEFLSKKSDVTRYVFFFPLKQMHPDAEGKSKYIICGGEQAYKEVYSGKHDKKRVELDKKCDQKAADILKEHIKVAQSLGVRGTPAFWVNGTYVSGANIQAIEGLLNQKGGK